MPGFWILTDDGVPVKVEGLLEWARWFEQNHEKRIVLQEEVGNYWVSTIFLGLDHSFGRGPPVLWETGLWKMKDGEPDKMVESCRATSRAEAIANHETCLALVKEIEARKS